jgi:hypothetical protein
MEGAIMFARRFAAGLAGLLVLAAGEAAAPAGAAEDVKTTARKLLEEHKDSVVLVEVVLNIKISFRGQSQDTERKFEVNGTVIRADGLTVISNTSLNPGAATQRPGLTVDSTPTSVKIVLADGTEHAARIALTDKDLDLAFVVPEEKVALPAVELGKAEAPGLLDSMVSIARLGRTASREPAVAICEVQSIVSKPRTRYVPAGQVYQACPVFSAAGKILGLAVHWPAGNNMLAVLPCEDILEVAGQVKAADGGAKKTDDEDKPGEADGI